MKQSWKLRLIFFIVCVGIVLYLGFSKNKLQVVSEQGYKEYNLVINEVMVNNRNSIRDEDGDYEDWIEIYNKGDKAINLHGFGLSNDSKQPFLWTFPDITIEPKSFYIVWASSKDKNESDDPIHTNFKLKNKDKVIILTAPNSNWNDIFTLEPMGENISYGRSADVYSQYYGFDSGTPGKANISEILSKGPNTNRLEGPIFSHNRGFYTETFNLILNSNDKDAKIYYTLDGSVPTKDSERYINPISIPSKTNEATVVRARVYKDGYPKSEIITQSYFVNEDIYNVYNTLVVSLVTDPKNLFDYEKGIYIPGKIFDQWKIDNPNNETDRKTPANYNQRGKQWEREGSIDLFKSNGELGLSQNIGLRISGGTSRVNKLKSLSLFAREDYDDNQYFNFDFFNNQLISPNKNEIKQLSQVTLRTSSSDSKKAFFRDALIQNLIESPSVLDTQSSRPCIVYINGEYYGIHNIREAYNERYMNEYYDIDEDETVIIKNPIGGTKVQAGYIGDEMHYNRMNSFIKNNNMKTDSNYNYIKTQIDIENFIEYNVLQIYCDNGDWPGNNASIWRKRTETYEANTPYGHDGRWRWLAFDLDFGFGLHGGLKGVMNNSLERATEPNGPVWPNPPWSTLLLRSLLINDEFKNQFINVFSDRLNTIFLPEVVINKIEDMKEIYYPNVKNHISKWDLHDNNVENWKDEIEIMKNFAIERPKYIRQYIIDYFNLSGITTIRVEMDEGGIVKINSLDIEQTDIPWEGIYFKDIPITVKATSKPGFIFVGWEGINQSQDKTIKINLSQSSYLKAVFKRQN